MGNEIMKLSQMEKEQMVAVNCYFMFSEAADMMLRYAEEIMKARGGRMTKRVKQRHQQLLDKVGHLKMAYDSFQVEYDESFKGEYRKQDDLRKSAAMMCRVASLILDRCYTEKEGGDKERMIEEYIYHMPEKGFVSKRMLEHFVIR